MALTWCNMDLASPARADDSGHPASLDETDWRIVRALRADGRLSMRTLAARLHISRHTVDGRLRRVFAKLGVNTRVEVTVERARVSG